MEATAIEQEVLGVQQEKEQLMESMLEVEYVCFCLLSLCLFVT